MIGKTLAHYEITAAIGKGGMGEVYQATDTKLGRSVAIKVLPEEFAQDAERVARFEREAKLLASLNHPNIAAIYGLEESEGIRFLVLELVEGQTLSERLLRGRLRVQESLGIALQIAEALEAAHEKGVIHRDLKPANIKVTSEGKVKVLDFGLAKAYAGAAAGEETVLETLAEDAGSGQGVLLGTPAYMSPEQARRQSADNRSDVWAFGCVLFELLTGKILFKGNTLSDTIVAILEREPDFGALPRHLDPRIRRLLDHCLTKNPKGRWQAIGDVRLEMEERLASPEEALQASAGGPSRNPYVYGYVLTALLLGALVSFLATGYLTTQAPEPRVTRFDLELPEGQVLAAAGEELLLALSPKGDKIVYVADSRLNLWDLERGESRSLQTRDSVTMAPSFSPDGQWVVYFSRADLQLKKISIDGGAPLIICEVEEFAGASWTTDDTIVYAEPRGIMTVSPEGGVPELLIDPEEGFVEYFPRILPDGGSLLYTVLDRPSLDKVVVFSLEADAKKQVIARGVDARYVPTGHVLYSIEDVLYAVGFDAASRNVTSGPVAVLEGIWNAGSPNYAVSSEGTLVYVPGGYRSMTFEGTLELVDKEGESAPLLDERRAYRWADLSPEADLVVVWIDDASGGDIWILDVESGTPSQLTDDDREKGRPIWTPDGERVTFPMDGDIYWQRADGSEPPELLWDHDAAVLGMSWSRDGQLLAFDAFDPETSSDIWILSLEEGTARLFETTPAREMIPAFSPDGEWIAYGRRLGFGVGEAWVAPYPGPGAAHLVSAWAGGTFWSRDGRELYYKNSPNVQEIVAVPVELKPSFRRGAVRPLFEMPASFLITDLHPDGERFLIIRSDSEFNPESNRINVVLNWFQELKEKVPAN